MQNKIDKLKAIFGKPKKEVELELPQNIEIIEKQFVTESGKLLLKD